MTGPIAVLNAGSSSIKFALYGGDENLLYRGQVEQIGVSPRLCVVNGAGESVTERGFGEIDHRVATHEIIGTVKTLLGGKPVAAVGHRVVHGGVKYAAPVRIDEAVMRELAALVPLAPLHQPHNLAPIAAIAEGAPRLPQVACFDTGFHRNAPALAQLFALPRELTAAGVRRYGFHGLSYEYIVHRLRQIAPELAAGRIIIAHLGNGASLCAVHRGLSIATTMGFTAVDGLMMGTRCGALDPGVLIYLMDSKGMDARAIENLVYRQSGLLGVSGISSDMRRLQASPEPAAAEAVRLFIYRIIREIGSLAAALGGLDGLIFTGGIGENDAAVRAGVAEGCRWLGLALDAARNTGNGPGATGDPSRRVAAAEGPSGATAPKDFRISDDASHLAAWVIPTDEERMVARHTSTILGETVELA